MNATQSLLTNSLDIWSAAETEKKSGRGRASGNAGSVYGIRKLRELILELAVRGKLVPQDPNAEPASALLKRIQVEKARLIAEKKIRKDRIQTTTPFFEKGGLGGIAVDEKPFELPHGWEWVRIGHIGHDWGQKTPDSDFTYIEVSAIDSQRGVVSSPELVKPENAPSRARKVVKEGTVIYSTIRPYLLNIAVIEEDFLPEPIASTAFAIVHPFCLMPPRFFLCFFRSPVFVRYVESVQMGIAYPAINDAQFFSGLIPLPPIEEQHRIVAKVDELMALCDQLETRHSNAAEAHEKLVSYLLATLTLSQNAEDFAACWQRIAAHFDTLFTTEASIDALKQTLLQLAVMGKLVPQDPNDEPASELLKKIATEKTLLIKEGKIKEQKPLSHISEIEKSYELAKGWEWVRLGTVAEIERGGSPRPIKSFLTDEPDGLNWIKIGDTDQGGKYITSTSEKIRREGLSKTRMVYPGDFLLTNSMSFGRPYITKIEGCIHDGWLRISPPSTIDKDYLYLLLSSSFVVNAFKAAAAGAVVLNLNADKVKELVIPVPPLAEQHRIVAKVDELMALCEQLKSRITDAGRLQQKLADVLVEQAVA